MAKLFRFFIKRKIITIFSAIVVFFVVYLGFVKGLSFKVNGDFFAMLATVSACKNYLSGNFDINLFPDALLYSPHTNLISWIIAFFSNLTGFEPIKAFYIIAPSGIVLFIFAFDYFLNNLRISTPRRALIIIISTLLVPTVASFNYIGDSIFTLADLLITALGWRIIGFALFFVCLGLAINTEKKPTNKTIILLFVVSFLLSNIYLPNFIFLFLLLSIYFIYESIRQKEINKRFFIVFISIAIGGLFNLLIWSYYDLFSLLAQSYRDFQVSPMIQSPESYDVNSPLYYLNILSISLFGFLFLFREKNRFIKISIIFCLLIILHSLFIPYLKIPYFWRFAIFLKLFLIIIILKNINLKIKSYSTAITIALAVSLFTIYIKQALSLIEKRPDNQGQLYQNLKTLDLSEGLSLSDERTSNVIQSIGTYKTYAIPNGHVASRKISDMNLAKIDELNKILRTYDYQKINNFLIKNKILYLVLNKDAEFVETFKLIRGNDFSFYPKITQTTDLTIIKIIPLR